MTLENTVGEALGGGDLPPLGPLVPVRAGSKGHAHLRNWQKVSPKVLQEVMARHPGCNVALRLDLYVALDPDSTGAVIFLGRLEMEGKLPPTVSWRSASGRLTRLYRPPPGVKVQPRRGELEIRAGRGQQCLIPPSQVRDKQGELRDYTWINSPWSTPVAVLPLETLRIIQKHAKPPKTVGGGRKAVTPGKGKRPRPPSPGQIAEGQRDDFLFRQGCSKRGRGAEREEIEAYLKELNLAKCIPPLDMAGVAKIAESAARYPANSKSGNLHLLRLTYEQVGSALEALGGREKWIRRAALVKKLEEMTGTPGNKINPPVCESTIEGCLRRMRSMRHVSHRKGGWYKLPQWRR